MVVPLEALLRRVVRTAEDMFDKLGEIDMLWIYENASGEQQMVVTPIMAPDGQVAAAYKTYLAAGMRQLFHQHDVVRYAVAAECWTLGCDLDPDYCGPLGEHPQRREAIIFEADDGRVFLSAWREIIRPAGGKPYLGKLSAIWRPPRVEGRFHDLLPRARSND